MVLLVKRTLSIIIRYVHLSVVLWWNMYCP
jgi:hypothetical protein